PDRPSLLRAPARRLAVPPVLRREAPPLQARVVVAVRPAEVRSPGEALHLLRRPLGVVLRGEARPEVELVAAVLHGVEGVVSRVPGERHRVADPRRPALPLRLRLHRSGGVEAPDPRPGLELRAGILPLDPALPVLPDRLAGVGGRADVDEEG